jgi:hypothetical protein
LWLIGVTLFLPTVRACEAVESPAQLVRDEPLRFGPLLAPFLLAELLLILVLVPLLRRVEPSRRNWLAALATVLPVFASPALLVFVFVSDGSSRVDHLYVAGCVVAMLLALVLLVAGARRRGWPALMSTVCAFTLLTLPLTVWFVQGLVEDRTLSHIYIGSVTFVFAMLGLTSLTACSLRAITRA